MYQEEFQRPLELFHQLILTIFNDFNGLFLFSISHLKDVKVITKSFSYFFQLEEGFPSEIQLNSSMVGNPQVYLEPSRISTMEPFCKNSQRLLVVNYFRKKVAS